MQPPSPPPPSARDHPLEGLRGLCAGAVLFAHAFAPAPSLDPRWAPPRQFWWFNLGYAAVMMFFVLSGYVIGLTTMRPASAAETRRYLARRALRLVPISTAAVLLAWALQPEIAGRTVLGNLLFLQNSAPYPGGVYFDLLPNNLNLWSLNHEVVYYLGFLALWWWKPPAGVVWGGLAVLALAPLAGFAPASLPARWACGGMYWLAGLNVAWLTPPPEPGLRRSDWPAALLGAYAIWTLAPLRSVLFAWDVKSLMWQTPVSPHRLDLLPACLWVLLAVTGRAPALRRWLSWTCLGWATLTLVYYAISHSSVELDWVAGVALALAWLGRRWTPSTRPLAWLAPLGAISFGVYAFALPLQFAQHGLVRSWSGSALTYATRLAVMLFIVVGLAWWFECRLQPWLRRRFLPGEARKFSRETSPQTNPTR